MNFVKGFIYALPISLALWALIIIALGAIK
jgi:hypothetical protein